MNHTEFENIIHTGLPIHLSGIGGVSMRALALLLKDMGANVRGSDRDRSPYTDMLSSSDIPVTIGHDAGNVGGAAVLIRTAAIGDDNPEIVAAKNSGIPVVERAQAWGLIMRRYPKAVCVSGTHGKTSTTSMLTYITISAGLDPTVMVGGDLSIIGGSLRIGHSDLIVAESCEYKNSFLSFKPTIAVILNVDRDHLDFFSDTDDIISSFSRFASLIPGYGTVVANHDDTNTMRAIKGIDRSVITFGISPESDVYPDNISIDRGLYRCDVMYKGQLFSHMELSVPGIHNLSNALASAAVSIVLGVSPQVFAESIHQYSGVGRRFEFKQKWRGAAVFDDYAHHPSEIAASLQTAKAMKPGRIICVFQPHTYSRTASLLGDFAQALSIADICVLCPIYAAREKNTLNISSSDLSDLIPNSVCAADFSDAAEKLKQIVQEGDLIFTMGAGDVFKINDLLK